MNILLTSANRKASLVIAFKEALAKHGGGNVFAADSSQYTPAQLMADESRQLPRLSCHSYKDAILGLCEKDGIDLVIPFIDGELWRFASWRREFEAVGTRLAVSSLDVALLCQNKLLLDNFFRKHSIPTPKLYKPSGDIEYPVIVKPAEGYSSNGVVEVINRFQLDQALTYAELMLVQERMEGDEYTVDILCDFSGKMISAIPRIRTKVRSGESFVGITKKHHGLIELAGRVVDALPGVFGCVNLQAFVSGSKITAIEVNPRFAGGYMISHAAGASFPELLIKAALGEPVAEASWTAERMTMRYDSSISVDL